MNARFWVFVNGSPVQLTLRPEQVLCHHGPTGREIWIHTGSMIVHRWEQVCNGRLWAVDRTVEHKHLRAGELDRVFPLAYPRWTTRTVALKG